MAEDRRDEGGRRSSLGDALRRYNVQLLYGASGIAYITLGIFVKQAALIVD
ncbi:MAG: hypothetical protein IIA23_04165 [Chloroflexi bacterium]|nr:hypothetical protein [Chloroflexota bacterium]